MLKKSMQFTIAGRHLLAKSQTIARQQVLKMSTFSTGSSNSRGPITMYSLGLIFLTCGGVYVYYELEKEKKVEKVLKETKTVGKAALGGPWVLVDKDGVPRTDASYRGKFSLLYFGFTYCPDICPSELVKVGSIMNELEEKKFFDLKPLFISVDPARDSLGQLKHYSEDFHPSIEYLTGTKDQVAAAAKAFRVYFSKANENETDEDDYLVDHSIVLYLISPDGEFLDFFTQRSLVGDVVSKVLAHADEYKQQQKKKTTMSKKEQSTAV